MKRTVLAFWLSMALLLLARIVVATVTPVFEPSEARYAAMSANMARTGDFLVPRFTHKGVYQPFEGKPPLVFQVGGLACMAIGVCEFAVRLFPMASAVLLLAILHGAVRRRDGARPLEAEAAVCICATSVAFYAAAGFCMTDIPLALCVSGALLVYSGARGGVTCARAVAMSALLGAGMLVKGPVALALFALPVAADAALRRRWREALSPRWLAGLPVFLAMAVPWFCMMQERNPDFLRYFFVNENLLRFLVHDYGDRYGGGRETFRGMALAWMFVTALPWSLAPAARALGAIRKDGFWAFARRFLAALRTDFPLVALSTIVAFWCLTSRVPLAYLLPGVPLFAAAMASRSDPACVLRRAPAAAALAVAALAVSLAAARFATDKLPGPDAERRVRGHRYSHEFYHGPWGTPVEGAR